MPRSRPDKREAILNWLDIKALYKQGSSSHYLCIPRLWLECSALKIDDKYWVQVEMDLDKITITKVDRAKVNDFLKANDVEPV